MSRSDLPPPGWARFLHNAPGLAVGLGVGTIAATAFAGDFGHTLWLGLALVVAGLLWFAQRSMTRHSPRP